MKPDYKLVAKAKYIHTTADLASELWHEVYKRYYPAKQLDTLVDTLQSADAIEEDIDNDVNYFLVLLGGKVIGYFAWKMENTSPGPGRGPWPGVVRRPRQGPARAAVLQSQRLPPAGPRRGGRDHAAARPAHF